MSQNLYQEAIAEAKKLREVAEQNAKNAIVEAVTPKIREFIEMQLVNDESYASQNDVLSEAVGISTRQSSNDDVVLSDSALNTLLDLATGGDSLPGSVKKMRNRGIVAKALNESLSTMSSSEKKKLLKIADKLKEQAESLDSSRIFRKQNIKTNVSKENDNMSRNDTLYEVNLKHLISNLSEAMEVEADMDEDMMDELDMDEMDMDELDMDELDMDEGDMDELHMDEGDLDEDMLDEVDMDELDEDELAELYGVDETDEGANPYDQPISEGDVEEGELDELDIILKGLPDEARDMIDLSQLSLEFLDDEEEGGEEGAEDLEMGMEDEEGAEEGGEEDEEMGMEDEEGGEEPLDEVFDIDLGTLKREIRRLAESSGLVTMGKKNKMSHAFGGKPSDHPSGESFGGGKRGKDPLQVKVRDAVRLAEAYKKERRRNRSLDAKLNQYASAVGSLREQLTEMNLFNAKLLYVNKLLQNGSISSSQRRAIIESLDSANSLREVKLLYRSLTESIANPKGGRGRINESSARRALGSSSRTVGGSSPRSAETMELNRWAKLAGIDN